MRNEPLCDAVSAKIREQVRLLDSLIQKLPEERLAWSPTGCDGWNCGQLLGHLLDCLAGMCAALYAARPEALEHFGRFRGLAVNHFCMREEARCRIGEYGNAITEGFSLLNDADLSRKIPTVFVSGGEPLLTLILGNLEHLTNHKHELFTRLKLMGIAVGTRDLYEFRSGAT
jgi:hypothetical protein